MEKYEFLLEDRIAKIQAINNEYDLEHNGYIAFSGGKDSLVLSHLIDIALPNNQIPRVYVNTGIEYKDMVAFVKEKANVDSRFIIINSGVNIKKMLEENGYPFKSKEHSLRVEQFNKGSNSYYIRKYISGCDRDGKPTNFVCPEILKYQFEERGRYNYSNRCCYKLKKEPIHKWQKENKRSIGITGTRAEEGGSRARLGCTIFKGSKLYHFHPLIVVSKEWEEEFIEKEKIKLCKLYYPPYNFRRTGCRACPYAIELQKELEKLKAFLPHEYKAAELLWKPVYDEYRRIGFRLKKEVNYQYNIFDYKEIK